MRVPSGDPSALMTIFVRSFVHLRSYLAKILYTMISDLGANYLEVQ
jgi:hypothetical protein